MSSKEWQPAGVTWARIEYETSCPVPDECFCEGRGMHQVYASYCTDPECPLLKAGRRLYGTKITRHRGHSPVPPEDTP